MSTQKITVLGLEIVVERFNSEDYISLTDIAKQTPRPPVESIRDWIRNSATLMFLQTWEHLDYPNFKVGHLPHFKNWGCHKRR